MSSPSIVIIGGGGTGAALLHDLAARGLRATLLERGEFTSGTTGRHHGQLHSGARYAVRDVEIARECMQEVEILQRIAPDSIEMNYGLFLALSDADVEYGRVFAECCGAAGIATRRISTDEALRYEPGVNRDALLAYVVPDGTIDAYRLPMQFLASAKANGGVARRFCEVTGIESQAGTIHSVEFRDHVTGRDERIPADVVVNAAGPWAGDVAALAGVDLPITPAPGTMVAVKKRLCNMVISHLHPPGDGDIIVPQRGIATIGSTQWETDDPDDLQSSEQDIDWLLARADDLVPGFSSQPFHAAWTAARPLAGRSTAGGRSLSRGFSVLSHAADGISGFFSITGGKATVLRAMAEQAADQVCHFLKFDRACATATTPLLSHREFFRRSA